MDEVVLKVNGFNYSGWLSIEIKKSVRALSGMFSLKVTDSWSIKKKGWIIVPGDYCELFIGSELMISGHIDDLEYAINPSSREITVTGRDKTGDLVDCSIDSKHSDFKNITLNALLQRLCSPFGIKVINETSINPQIESFGYNQGSSVYDAIDELSKKYGFVACSTPDGNLSIPRIGEIFALDYIEEGVNLFDGSVKFDHKDRFSRYVLKGQVVPSDNFFGEAANAAAGVTTDPEVKRYRPKVINSSGSSTGSNLLKRSEWEMNLRSSKSTAGSVSLKGWRQRSGSLWKENTMINYKSNYLGLETQLLIGDITYSLDDKGRRVTFDLMRKEVFLSELQLGILTAVKQKSPEAQLGAGFFDE
jgi:prophage tail gpP-like protein